MECHEPRLLVGATADKSVSRISPSRPASCGVVLEDVAIRLEAFLKHHLGLTCRSARTPEQKLTRRPCSPSQRRLTSISAATASQCSTMSGTSPLILPSRVRAGRTPRFVAGIRIYPGRVFATVDGGRIPVGS